MSKDDAGVWHNTRSVEVYLPWSDTWFNLYALYLVGGMNIDIAIMAVKPTKHIYNLVYNGTYHWTHDTPDILNMLKQCKQCCLVFQNQKIFNLKEVFLEFDIEGTVK